MAGLIRKSLTLLAMLAIATLVALTATLTKPATRADACAFPFTPTTYEDLRDRDLFLDTIDLAAANLLFPGDPYFGVPDLETGLRTNRTKEPGKVPAVLLKAIGWIESSITQGGASTPFGSIGPSLVSFDCGHGIGQITSGMTVGTGELGRGSPNQALVATHYAYNIARSAVILADKWNEAPEFKPIAGTDTGGSPAIIENWYYAVWAYNGYTGPGANRSNHPMDPIYGSWPRVQYSCGPAGDGKGHNRGAYPYQELVFGCATNPPVVENQPLWKSQALSLPDLNKTPWKEALNLDNFVFPYSKMDIPSPQPAHRDETPLPDASLRQEVIGSPKINLSRTSARLGFTPGAGSTAEVINISNEGTGVLSWYATPNVPWVHITPYTGAAVGTDLPCETNAPCDRVGRLEITIDSETAPAGRSSAQITIQALGTDQQMVVNLEVTQVIRLGAPGVTRN